MRKPILGLALMCFACSSDVNEAGRAAVTSKDSGSRGGASGMLMDASRLRGDATHSRTDSATPTDDGAVVCERIEGPPPDFSITLTRDVDYDGPVTVERADGGAEALVARLEGGELRATFDGVVPTLSPGSTLWASFVQQTTHSNPYHSATTTHGQLRASEHHAVLAETRRTYADTGPTTFLDASMDISPLCTHPDSTNSATGGPCLTTELFSVTIHGDTDLTLFPASEGHVTIHGVEYDVWLSEASSENLVPSIPSCIQDWGPHPGVWISGRAVRYGDILNAAAHDAGSDH